MKPLDYREVQAKGILNSVRGEDDWFGLTYNMNLYRGCEHQCIYCDTRSACYRIENFDEEVLIKTNALELLEDALPRKRKLGVIGFGSMNDPYTPAEDVYGLTGEALKIVAKYRFPGAHHHEIRPRAQRPGNPSADQSGQSPGELHGHDRG